ncbi:hypothetical protein [Methylobacterium radiotolerans]|uniref:hypothetical protein n=1 Tax=Methylobacterium radiotolerans TaxID=31998 RepID=UPI003396CD87
MPTNVAPAAVAAVKHARSGGPKVPAWTWPTASAESAPQSCRSVAPSWLVASTPDVSSASSTAFSAATATRRWAKVIRS